MLKFYFLGSGKGIVSPPHFVFDFSREMFLNFIIGLLFLLEILINTGIVIVCDSGCDAIHFEINLIFLIKSSFYMTKSQDKNLNILRTKRAFKVK